MFDEKELQMLETTQRAPKASGIRKGHNGFHFNNVESYSYLPFSLLGETPTPKAEAGCPG
jgi:hypothetical protein